MTEWIAALVIAIVAVALALGADRPLAWIVLILGAVLFGVLIAHEVRGITLERGRRNPSRQSSTGKQRAL